MLGKLSKRLPSIHRNTGILLYELTYNVDQIALVMNNMLIETLNEIAPYGRARIHKNHISELSDETKCLIKQRNRAKDVIETTTDDEVIKGSEDDYNLNIHKQKHRAYLEHERKLIKDNHEHEIAKINIILPF